MSPAKWCLSIAAIFLSCNASISATEFAAPAAYAVGSSPQTVVIGDFNGDGKPDFAVLNTVSNSVSILLGKGDGTFQAAKNFSAGNNPTGLATGDFNGDGKLDLVVFMAGNPGATSAGEIRILLGNGDGSFQAPAVTTLTTKAVAFAVGDVNGDKSADVVVGDFDAQTTSSDLQLLLAKGDGTFQAAKTILASGLASPQVALADFNKDGKLDLAINGTQGITVLLGQGDGTFVAGSTSTALSLGTAARIWTADLNNDGNADLIVSSTGVVCSGGIVHICATTQNIGVLLGDGSGSFAAEQVFLFSPSSNFLHPSEIISFLSIGDFNGDGKLDVIYRSGVTGSPMVVRLGLGDGTFSAGIVFSDEGPVGTAMDLNGDKLSDVITLDPTNSNVKVLLNDSPGSGADLGIVGSGASPNPLGLGLNLTYTADILNEGPQDATGVTLKDTLPSGVTFVSATASQGTCSNSGQIVSCAIGVLADAHDATVTIVVTPTVSGTLTNNMEASGTESDLALANNSASQTSTVLPFCTLTVTESGSASGSVKSTGVSPKNSGNGSIDCGSTCSAKFLSGTQVTLSAGVDVGNFFTGWGGACSGSGGCTVTMTGNQAVTAKFVKGNILSVTLGGNGSGVVRDTSVAIFVCTSTNGDCSPSLLPGSSISIQAVPSGNSVFAGWSGACTGTDPNACSITMNSNEAVTATFNPPPDFEVNPTLPSLTLKAGSKVSEILSVLAQGSFSAAVALNCSVSGPAPTPSCGISPNSVNPGTKATLTVDASGISATAVPLAPFQIPTSYVYCITLVALAFLLVALADQERRRTWLAVAILVMSVFPAACGSASSGPPPPKNFTVTVTAVSGALQHSTTINVTVD